MTEELRCIGKGDELGYGDPLRFFRRGSWSVVRGFRSRILVFVALV